LDEIARFDPQLIVVANFSQILRRPLLDLPPLGVINLHPSLLPKYRGPMPYYWVLQNREPTSGVTVHFVDENVDTGDIVAQVAYAVHSDDTEISLRRRSARMAAPLLVAATRDVLRGTARRVPQDAENATYYGFPPRGASLL
jgi:methionyl-tRNA formyltransferase